MRPDLIETVAGATIQHGPFSDRLYLMKLGGTDPEEVLPALHEIAEVGGYGKIFAKVPAHAAEAFLAEEYTVEAVVPGLYRDEVDGLFLAHYPAQARREPEDRKRINDVLRTARAKADDPRATDGIRVVEMRPEHAPAMAELYKKVFPTYPFPIHDPKYIVQSMDEDVRFFGVLEDERPVALASAEVDPAGQNAEMTDFATSPEQRGRSLAAAILAQMERSCADSGIKTFYTICRAAAFGVNILFARAGYVHAGLLPNNTNISGGLESMNVWHRKARALDD